MKNQYETFPEITIEEFDAIQEDHGFSKSYQAKKRGLIRRYEQKKMRSRKFFGLPPAAAAAAIFGLCTVTAFAGVSIYQFAVTQKGNYSVEAGLSIPQTADLKEVDEVTLNIGFVPEDMALSGKGEYAYVSADDMRGYYVDTLVADTEGSWTEYFVNEAKPLTIGSREALLIQSQTVQDNVDAWKQYDLFLSYPEYNRIVKVWGWGQVEEAELLKFGEHIGMQSTGSKVAVADQPTWSQYLISKAAVKDSAVLSEALQLTADADAMCNLHQMNDSFLLTSGTDVNGNPIKVSAKVTGVQTADDFALLQPEYIDRFWNDILDKNGKIGSAQLQFTKNGDGINTMDRIVHTESVPMKLVYVTMELKNEGVSDLPEYGFFGSLMRIIPEGKQWRIPELGENVNVSEAYDSAEYATPLLGFDEMYYWDVEGSHPAEKNYITNFAAGDTKEVHMAWLVPADQTDHMYLNLGNNWQAFSESDLELGYVELSESR